MRRGIAGLCSLALLAGCSQAGPTPQASEKPATTARCIDPAAHNMAWIPGGTFVMGSDPHYPEEGPPRLVTVKGFWMDAHEVTNAQFAAFVKATGYRTMAERQPPQPAGASGDLLKPGSAVFTVPTRDNPIWWRWVAGAQWRHPSGPATGIAGQDAMPVVQIAYQDAQAYARWAGKQMPSEEQWEYAARAGTPELPEPVDADGKPQANYYQGVFPVRDLGTDGFVGRAPVGCFKPNGFGLYDMIGNVWEWTSAVGTRADASEPVNVIKGGSFLCAANYCARYRPAARQFQERGLGTDHIGFRLIDTHRPPPA